MKKGDSHRWVDVIAMKDDLAIKILEMEWKDHFQTRSQTWQALQIAGILTVALVGIEWKTSDALIKPWVGIFSSILLICVSLLGLQITFRHRNWVEINKFTAILELEKKFNFITNMHIVPKKIRVCDIFKIFSENNTSLFLARIHTMIIVIGIFMLILSVVSLKNNVPFSGLSKSDCVISHKSCQPKETLVRLDRGK